MFFQYVAHCQRKPSTPACTLAPNKHLPLVCVIKWVSNLHTPSLLLSSFFSLGQGVHFICLKGLLVMPSCASPLLFCITQQKSTHNLVLWASPLFNYCIPCETIMDFFFPEETNVKLEATDWTATLQQRHGTSYVLFFSFSLSPFIIWVL